MEENSDAVGPKPKKQRQSHAKVKSGCLTCKIRRVKCDETKPDCLKCTSTWRKCDGYRGKEPLKFINTTAANQAEHLKHDSGGAGLVGAMNSSTVSGVTGPLRNPLLDFSGTQMEHRSLDFFQKGAAPALSGYFDAEFWNEILPRVAYSEPAIQHALIALGSLYEYCSNAEDYPTFVQQRYALVHYNKAIRALKTYRVEDPKTREIMLLTCVLFVCLELLSGDPERALDHLNNGLNILTQWQRSKGRAASLTSPASQRNALRAPQSTEDVLDSTFSRLSLQASLCARRLPRIYPMIGRVIVEDVVSARIPFRSIQEARSSLSEIFIQSFQPSEPPDGSIVSHELPSPPEKPPREALISELHYWNSRLALYIADSLPNLPKVEIHGARVLRILSIIAIIWNSVTATNTETSYDAHLTDYQTVVSLASSLIAEFCPTAEAAYSSPSASPSTTTTATLSSASSTPPTTLPPSTQHGTILPEKSKRRGPAFTFEMSLIPALYFTALKCRSPSLRRRAVSLLRCTIPQREGLWDAQVLAAVAQRIIDIEEGAGPGSAVSADVGRCLETPWPVEERRIHSVVLTPGEGAAERRTQGLQLVWKPDGVDGGWRQFGAEVAY